MLVQDDRQFFSQALLADNRHPRMFQRAIIAIISLRRDVVVLPIRSRTAIRRYQPVHADVKRQHSSQDSVGHRIEVSRHVELTIREAIPLESSEAQEPGSLWFPRCV